MSARDVVLWTQDELREVSETKQLPKMVEELLDVAITALTAAGVASVEHVQGGGDKRELLQTLAAWQAKLDKRNASRLAQAVCSAFATMWRDNRLFEPTQRLSYVSDEASRRVASGKLRGYQQPGGGRDVDLKTSHT